MADSQITAGGVSAAPLAYTIPGAQEIIVKAAFASFDGALAAGAFLPCIRVVAPGGKIVGEYITDESVAAGSSAEVSFAPFLRGAAAAPTLTSGGLWADLAGPGVGGTIPSGVVTTLDVVAYTSFPGSQPPFSLDGAGNPIFPLELAEYRVWVELAATWQAGAYDRYVEFSPPGTATADGELHIRQRGAATPDDDRQTVAGVLTGNPFAPVLLNMQAFQNSGVPKVVTGEFAGYGWPRLLNGFYG